jgi:hypothetical protein
MAQHAVEYGTRQRTVCLDADADAYLVKVIVNSRGYGAFISRLIHEHKLRKEIMSQYQAVATKEEWNQTGLCVD